MRTRKRAHGHEVRPCDGPHDQLGDAITPFDTKFSFPVSVQQGDFDLTAVPGVDRSRRVHDRDAITGCKSAARHHESGESVGKSDGGARAHRRALPWSEHHRFVGDKVCTGVAGVRVTRQVVTRDQYIDVVRHASRLVHGRMVVMSEYRERLWPSPWIIAIAALAIPASLLTFAAIDPVVGAITGVVLFGGVIALATISAPTIEVGDGVLRAGKARVPLAFVGETELGRGLDARHARGQGLDARAYLVIRGDIDPVARIAIVDPDDPTPYWLISTRRPEALIAAIEAARAHSE